MMDIGRITGFKIGKNRDGDIDRVLLQVEMITGEDTRTVELISQHGEDINPASGCRAVVTDVSDAYQICVAITDDLTPEVEPGEKEIYSTDNPVTAKQARIYLNKDGEIILNQGTKSALNHPDTVNALNTFLTALNGQLTGLGAAGGLTIDLTAAEVPEVLL